MRLTRPVLAVGALGLAGWLARVGHAIPEAMGDRPSGARAERLRSSPEWADGTFHNPSVREEREEPAVTRSRASIIGEVLSPGEDRRPAGEVPVVRGPVAPAHTGTHVTWLGHSCALLQIDGATVLLDPVWSDRCSPSQRLGPLRHHPVPCALDELPPVDVVVISHDHYDHLDMNSIKELAAIRSETRFLVPLGVGAHLEKWGVPADRIDELDWHEDRSVAGVRFIATPAQHFSGRSLRRNETLWASWAIVGSVGKVFYSGDTGYFDGFTEIGERYGPFDVSLVQVGAYDDSWLAVHMTPEQGVAAHVEVKARVMVPVHWATFTLAFHPWAEPAERVTAESGRRGVRVVVPRPGETVDLGNLPVDSPAWWRDR